MDQSILICASDAAFLEKLSRGALSAGFRVEKSEGPPKFEQFEAAFPDLLLVDIDLIGGSPAKFLEELSGRYPSLQTYLLAGSEYSEEVLFAGLRSGARGWIFKDTPEKVIQQLAGLIEENHFFKPFVSQLILQEFKKFPEGEALLPIEEEILRQSARGVPLPQIEQNLNLPSKLLHGHWDSLWQKLNINARAEGQIEEPAPPLAENSPAADSVKQEKEPGLPSAEALREAPLDSPDKESLHLVTFRLGNEEFAFSITELQEIQKMMPVTPLPRVPSYVVGIINLRGTIVPIIDLRIKLGFPVTAATKEARIILVNVEGKLAGVIVDSVKEVLRVPASHAEAPPALVLTRNFKSIKSVINIQNRLILWLDLKEILFGHAKRDEATPQLARR